ncbi:MAG: ATP-binding protein [Lachnospiraceae bacterium]|nr:ATP-binding protein [Lachnospiraceae bacterium]
MDFYRQHFLEAQRLAGQVIQMKKNQYLSSVPADSIRLDATAYVPSIRKWYHLKGFRMQTDEEQTMRTLRQSAAEWLRSARSRGGAAAFVLSGEEGELNIFYGNGGSTELSGMFGAMLPECEGCLGRWEGAAFAYNGILLGSADAEHIADMAAASEITDYYVSCVVIPAADEEIQEKLAENETILSYLNDYKSFQRVYGTGSRRVEEVPIPEVVRAISLLKEENEYLLRNMGQGFVRSAVRFGAPEASSYRRLESLLLACLHQDQEVQQGFEPVRSFGIRGEHRGWQDCLAVPRVEFEGGAVYPLSWQAVTNVANFCVPPLNSCKGFYVRNYHVNEASVQVFPLTKPVTERGAAVGKIKTADWDAVIPHSALLAHSFASGASNTGKTTTIKRLLKELYEQDISFTVIEAAKKEYIGLLPLIPELKIYTPGTDGQRLFINPLQPEDGVLIENHVDAVARAVIASNGGEHPIPEAFTGLLKQTYEKAGWQYGTMAYHDRERPFPTFADALANIPEYIAKHGRYGPEVRKNLEGALTIRAEHMDSGALGQLFSSPFGLTARELLETPAVIELADFSDSSTEFLMNILMFKFHSYLSRLPSCGVLKRVIVVEEAHNVFRRTLMEENGRALNNNYFERMLAEIRSSGTGLILSDQRPGIMSDAVMANTAVKIVHSMDDAADRSLVGEAINLSEFQTDKIRELAKGECIIGIRGNYGVQHAAITALPDERISNAACHICTRRFRCQKEAVERLIQEMEPEQVRFHLSKVRTDLYNVRLLSENISSMLRDLHVTASDTTKLCFLGAVLVRCGDISFQDSRTIVSSYAGYLAGQR